MNKTYKSVWNATLGVCVAAPETVRTSGRCAQAAVGLALACSLGAPVSAATLYWDPNGNVAGLGGAGTWNTTNAFWNSSASGTGGTVSAWNNAGLDQAVFGGAVPSVVTVGTVTASGLAFSNISYTLNGGSITLVGAAPTISTTTQSFTINSALVSNTGFALNGDTTLILGGNNSALTGPIILTAGSGTLQAAAIGAFGVNAAVTLASNSGILFLNGFSQSIGSLAGGTTGARTAVNLGSATLTVGTDDTSTTFVGRIVGAGGRLVKVGSGTLTLTNGLSGYTGGTAIDSGRIDVDASGTLGTGAVAMATGSTLGFGTAGVSLANAVQLTGPGAANIDTGAFTGTLTGAISGAGALSKQGSGALVLSGTNTYTGATTINAGTLQAGAAAGGQALGLNSAVTLSNVAGASLNLNGFSQAIGSLSGGGASGGNVTLGAGTLTTGGNNTSTSYLGTISGTGGLTKNGSGVQTLSGSNSYTGATTINAGTLQAGAAAGGLAFGNSSAVTLANVAGATLDLNGFNQTVGSLTGGGANGGNVTLGSATLTTGGSNTSTNYAGVISGSGGLTKTGTGVQTLSGISTYVGATAINGGTLQAGAAAGGQAFGLNSAVALANVAGARLDLNNFSQTVGSLSGGGASGGNLALGAGTLTTGGNSTNTSYAGVISGTGGLTKAGTGVQTLSGTNTYTGATTINAGTLQAGATAGGQAFGLNSAAVLANVAGARLDLNGFSQAIGSLSGGGASGGNVTLGAGTLTTGGNNTSTSYLGTISGTGGLTKSGSGVQTLSGTNTYTGATTINAGTLQAGAAAGGQAFGLNSAVTLANVAGARLDLNNFSQTVGSLSGGGVSGGNVTLGAGTLTTGGNNTSTSYLGTISGTGGLIKIGNGVQTLSRANTYTGATIINAGSLRAGAAAGGQAFGLNSAVTLSNVAGAKLDLNNFSQTVGSLSGGAVGGNVTLGVGTLTTGGDNTSTSYAGMISGTGGLIKTGTGTQTLAGARSSIGSASVTAGTLELAQTGAFTTTGGYTTTGGAATQIDADATLAVGGAFTQATGSTLNVALGTTQPIISATTANLAGTLNITGFGASVPNTASALTSTQFNVIRTTGGITGDFSPVSFGGASSPVDYLTLAGGKSADNLNYNVGFGLSWLAGTTAGNGIFTLANAADTFNVDVVLANQSASATGWDGTTLTKNGAGTLTLSAVNTYSGPTIVNGGTLATGIANAFANSNAVNVAAGATLDLNGFNQVANNLAGAGNVTLGTAALTANSTTDTAFGGTISGAGSLVKTGAGTLSLAGDSTYSGGTTISAGTLQLGNGGTTGSVVGNITNNATLAFNRSDAQTFDGVISGSGTVTKLNGNTLTLTGANTYSGGTALKGGQLTVGHNSALGSGALSMDDGTALGFSVNSLDLSNAVVLTGTSDPVVDTGTFTETLSGVISGSGALTKNGSGTLVLSGANTYSGATTVAAGTLRAGAADTFSAVSIHTVTSGATLDTAGFNQRVAALTNNGTVSLVGAIPGSTLTAGGAYVGNGGLLRLGTALAGSASVSDRLVLDGPGASASGSTTIQIANVGGLGALTTGNGIEVVSGLNGATTTAQTTKSAFSLQNGHVDAGAFEYRLYAADVLGAGENWYLRSTSPTSEQPVPPPSGSVIPPIRVPTYRAEVPLLAALPAQMRQADLAMLGNLHRRMGDEAPAASAGALSTGSGAQVPDAGSRRAWGRVVYADLGLEQPGVAQARTDGHVSGLQAGTDLWVNPDWHAGVYVGYLDGSADVSGNARGLTARVGSNNLRSRFLGAYATWMEEGGWYVDSVLQGASQRYDVKPDINPQVSGKASSYTASVEAGKAYALDERWSIEPQAQLAYQHSSFDDLFLGGARVRQDANGGWIARLGVRIKGDLVTGAGRLQPYGRLNLYHASFGDDAATFIGPAGSTVISSGSNYSAAEVAAGATLALTPATSLYGEIGHLCNIGGDATVKSSVQATLGIKVQW